MFISLGPHKVTSPATYGNFFGGPKGHFFILFYFITVYVQVTIIHYLEGAIAQHHCTETKNNISNIRERKMKS
jgi:hypothetical protein